MTELSSLRNIGARSAQWLRSVGIQSAEELEALGALRAYQRVKAAYPHQVTLNMLYALEGALLDLPWNELPPDLKTRLRDALDLTEG